MATLHEDWFDLVISPDQLDQLLASGTGSEKQLLKYLRHFLDHSRQYDGKELGSESQQGQVLLAMSAKIFAQLRYSLAKIAHKLPIALAHRLMLWLCASCGLPDPYKLEQQQQQQLLSPSARWLYQLYHRWALRCLVHENYVKKPPRSVLLQPVSGITDRSTELHCAQSQEVAAHLRSRVERSLECLLAELPILEEGSSEAAAAAAAVALPGPGCFRVPSLAEPDCRPDWAADSRDVTQAECRCLVHFDLGQFYFMQRRYSQAFDHFTAAAPGATAAASASAIADDLEDPIEEAEIPGRQLDAYLTAIRSVSRQADARPRQLQRLEQCRARHWDGLVQLLTEELACAGAGRPQLPDYYWDTLAAEVASSEALDGEVKFQVRTCRLVRRALDDSCAVLDYPQLLASRGSAGVRALVSAAAAAASAAASSTSLQVSSRLRRVLRYILGQLRPPPGPADLAAWPGPPGDLLQAEPGAVANDDDGEDDVDMDGGCDGRGDEAAEEDEYLLGATDGGPVSVIDKKAEPEEVDEEAAFHREAELACGQTADDLRLLICYSPAEAAALAERLCRAPGWSPAAVASVCRAWEGSWHLAGSQQQQQQQQLAPLMYHQHHHHNHHGRHQHQQQQPNHPQAAAAAVLLGKANVLQRLGEYDLARQMLTYQLPQQLPHQQQQQQQFQLLLLDMRRCLTDCARPSPELAAGAEAALRQMQEGGNIGGGQPANEEAAILASCVMLWSGRLPPQSALGSGQQQQPSAANYCVDFARLLMLAAADREARASTAAAAAGAAAATAAGQKAPSHTDLWARVGRLFAALDGAKRSGVGAQSSTSTSGPSPPHELGFAKRCFRRLLRWLRSEQHIDLLLSLLVKLACLACTELNVPVHSACPELWPDQLPARLLTVVQRASVRGALRDLLQTALSAFPGNPSWLVTRADLAFAEHEPGLALRCYLEAAVAASELFERPLPIGLFGDDTLRRMVRCCELTGMRACAGVLAQAVPDQATSVRLLADPVSSELSDALLPYLWDLSLLEILTAVSARRGALAKRDKFVHAARAMELNSCNRPDLLHEVETAKRAEFLRALSGLVFGSG